MTVVLVPECDACGASGQQLDSDVATAEQCASEAGLVDGSEFGLKHVHMQCAADLRQGVDPARDYGFPMVSVPDVESR